ncbi:MAG: hypothetical protein OXC28_13280 [Defluviicoccus sp.]|nr:hypothetical protein [Defluviicoccus sp.]
MTNSLLTTLRAATLAATRDEGTATGPGIETDVDLIATRCMCSGMDLLVALQDDNADALAQGLGSGSAVDLMAFLSEGPETARLPMNRDPRRDA